MKQLRIIVTGNVQGVGFRSFARFQAQKRGLNGFAQNTLDGNVEIVIQGNESACDSFAKAIQNGLPWARPSHCNVTEEKPVQQWTRFEIKH